MAICIIQNFIRHFLISINEQIVKSSWLIRWDIFSIELKSKRSFGRLESESCCPLPLLVMFFDMCFSSRYFHWKMNLCVILLILVFMVPFYIGYFIVSNIRLCEYFTFVLAHRLRGIFLGAEAVESFVSVLFSVATIVWGHLIKVGTK